MEETVGESEEDLSEEEAWHLLMAEEEMDCWLEPEERIVINLARRETLETLIKVDLKDGNVMQGEAVVDTGSVLSFLSLEAMKKCAPHLLPLAEKYSARITGISGEDVEVLGTLTLPCLVAGRALVHQFVVADVVEPVLLGMDFLNMHRATWDWLTGELVYQVEKDPALEGMQ